MHITGREALVGLRRTLDRLTSETFHARDHVYTRRPTQRAMRYGGDEHGCFYTADGKPDCLIAQYLTLELGLTVEDLKRMDARSSNDISDLIKADVFGHRFTFDNGALKVLYAAQDAQDNDKPWGDAEQAAQTALENY